MLESTLSFLSARPLPYWYTTKIRIIIETTKFLMKKNYIILFGNVKTIPYLCIVNLKQQVMKREEFLKAIKGTKFETDLSSTMSVNGAPMSHAYWNLILSIRDCKLYSKGIKPHRNWKISDVKWYFGVKGGAEVIAEKLEQYKTVLTAE